jgi:hypothetical protein
MDKNSYRSPEGQGRQRKSRNLVARWEYRAIQVGALVFGAMLVYQLTKALYTAIELFFRIRRFTLFLSGWRTASDL